MQRFRHLAPPAGKQMAADPGAAGRIERASGYAARPGRSPRVVYATCSVLPCENEDRIAAFLARHPNFAIRPAREAWSNAAAPPGLSEFFRASPLSTGTDGFFTAILARKS